MIETVDSDDDDGDLVEEAKPKAKKKGKNSPATTRKERSATPDVSIQQYMLKGHPYRTSSKI
jgi:hypothetical protein